MIFGQGTFNKRYNMDRGEDFFREKRGRTLFTTVEGRVKIYWAQKTLERKSLPTPTFFSKNLLAP